MKRALRASMLLFLVGLLSLPVSLSAKPDPQALGEQALKEAERVWHSVWTECSGTDVARFDGEYCVDIACTGGKRRSPLYLSQRKDVYFIVTQSRSLSEADRLNGVTWSGEIRAKWTAEREYSFKSNKWSDWRTPTKNVVFVLERRSGRWSVRSSSLGDYDNKITKVTCADLDNPGLHAARSDGISPDPASGFRGDEVDVRFSVKKIGPNEWEIILPANLRQLDTEPFPNPIYVRAGQTVIVSANGRVNSSGYRTSNDGSYRVVGPDGWPSNPAFNRGRRSPLPPSAPFMALAMRVGNGTLNVDDGGWTLIGSHKSVVASQDGYLHFTVNDMNDPTGQSDWWSNNEGGLKIRVRIQ